MKRIKKGDDIIVISGKDKGRRGTVLNVIDEDGRVLVEGINVVKKHQKPNPNAGVQGGIIEQEHSLHVSNVMLFNPVTGKGDRVGVKTLEDGRKVRFFKSNNEVVDV
jgi:large subunit ribosomal protein L24